MSATMACGTVVSPGAFALLDRPLPEEAPPGEVLLDVAAVGICGTDYHIFEGTHPFLAYPRVIGHELSAGWRGPPAPAGRRARWSSSTPTSPAAPAGPAGAASRTAARASRCWASTATAASAGASPCRRGTSSPPTA